MSWLTDRLTGKRLAAIGLVVALAAVLVAFDTPLRHAGEGPQADGQVGVGGMGRIVEIAAIVIAFLLALPPPSGPDPEEEGQG